MHTPSYDADALLRDIHEVGFYSVMSQLEETLIKKTLELTGNNYQHASELLKLNRTTLVQKSKRYDIWRRRIAMRKESSGA